MIAQKLDFIWRVPHGNSLGKNHRTTKNKTTVAIYLDKSLVEEARNQGVNLSQFMQSALEQALSLPRVSFGKENLLVARKRLELLSRAPEAPMLGRYTTGLQNRVPLKQQNPSNNLNVSSLPKPSPFSLHGRSDILG